MICFSYTQKRLQITLLSTIQTKKRCSQRLFGTFFGDVKNASYFLKKSDLSNVSRNNNNISNNNISNYNISYYNVSNYDISNSNVSNYNISNYNVSSSNISTNFSQDPQKLRKLRLSKEATKSPKTKYSLKTYTYYNNAISLHFIH